MHEIAPSKNPLVYDLQELFRHVVDYSVIELLETKLKKSDFIVTENYHIRLKRDTARKLIEKIKENFNRRYELKNKQYPLDNILFENVRILSKCLLEKLWKSKEQAEIQTITQYHPDYSSKSPQNTIQQSQKI